MKYAVIILSLLLTACEPQVKTDRPHVVAANYFDALYNDRSLEQAKALSTEHNQEMLDHFGTISTVGHYRYNMSFDSVEVRSERPTGIRYLGETETVRIRVAFSGYFNGERVYELREVVVMRVDKEWRVDRLLDAPYQ